MLNVVGDVNSLYAYPSKKAKNSIMIIILRESRCQCFQLNVHFRESKLEFKNVVSEMDKVSNFAKETAEL